VRQPHTSVPDHGLAGGLRVAAGAVVLVDARRVDFKLFEVVDEVLVAGWVVFSLLAVFLRPAGVIRIVVAVLRVVVLVFAAVVVRVPAAVWAFAALLGVVSRRRGRT
jgi:hypothetical protein